MQRPNVVFREITWHFLEVQGIFTVQATHNRSDSEAVYCQFDSLFEDILKTKKKPAYVNL